jgi:hypothetical protein
VAEPDVGCTAGLTAPKALPEVRIRQWHLRASRGVHFSIKSRSRATSTKYLDYTVLQRGDWSMFGEELAKHGGLQGQGGGLALPS